MKVKDLLTKRSIVKVAPQQTVLEATCAMTANQVGSVLVVDAAGRTIGIFTERDLMVRVVAVGRIPAEVRVEEVMTRELYVTTADRPIMELREELRRRHIRHVPVVENDVVIAVISGRDLVRAALEEQRRDVQEMTRYIQGNM
jgi:CBS domain-containing protein